MTKKCKIKNCDEIPVVKVTDIAPLTIGDRQPAIKLCHTHFKAGAMSMYDLIDKPKGISKRQLKKLGVLNARQ